MTAHLTRIKTRLSIHAHRKVKGLLEGGYAAVHVGRGMDFNDLREYARGDDVKDIDWKASARTRQLLIRRYVAERKHHILLCVSTGRSMAALNDTGATVAEDQSKRELAVFVAGTMGYLATQHGDMVGLAHGDDLGQHLQPSRAGELHLERMLSIIDTAIHPDAGRSNLTALLRHVTRTVRRRTILVIICDETSVSDEDSALLRRLAAQHEVLFITLGDLDPTVPMTAGRPLVDIDAGTEVPAWLRHDAQLRREYADLVGDEQQELRHRMDQAGIAFAKVRDTDSAIAAIHGLLERHRHARRR